MYVYNPHLGVVGVVQHGPGGKYIHTVGITMQTYYRYKYANYIIVCNTQCTKYIQICVVGVVQHGPGGVPRRRPVGACGRIYIYIYIYIYICSYI